MLDLLTAAPTEVAFGPKTYRVGALKMREFGLLQRWIREHSERPTIAAERLIASGAIDPEDRRAARKQAVIDERDWPPSIGSAEGNRILLGDPEGQRFFVRTMLGKFRPELGDAELDDFLAGLSPEHFGVLVAIAFGEDGLDPKALAGTAPAEARRGDPAAADTASTGPGSSPG